MKAASAEALGRLYERFKPDGPLREIASGNDGHRFDVRAYLAKYGQEVVKIKKHGSSTLYCLKRCVINPDHKGNEAAIGQTADGKLFYHCFHDSCKGITWHDARQKISGSDHIGESPVSTGKTPPAPPTKAQMLITHDELSSASLSPACIVLNYLYACIAVLAAPGGTGKTTQVLYEMICIVLGLPLYGLKVIKRGWCLYVTAEDTREILIARLREIMRAMGLTADEQQLVMKRVLIWDVTGEPVKLIRADNGNVVLTSLSDDIIKAYQADPPVEVAFDPCISFGASESLINDNEQGLITAARRIMRGLRCCVRMIAHTGKVNARSKTLDQYTSRGGSALSDGARMVAVLQSWQPGDEKKPPQECTYTPDSSITVLARPKLSYAPANQPLIWIKRTGWTFEHFIETPVSKEDREKALFTQVERFLASQVSEGIYHNKTSLEKAIKGIKRADARNAIEKLMAQDRIIEVDLPKDQQVTRRRTYLTTSAGFGSIRKNDLSGKVNSAGQNNAAALWENNGGIIPPPIISPGPNAAGDDRQDSAALAGFDDEVLL